MDKLFSNMRDGPLVPSPNDSSTSSPLDKFLSNIKDGPPIDSSHHDEGVECATNSVKQIYSKEMNVLLSKIKDVNGSSKKYDGDADVSNGGNADDEAEFGNDGVDEFEYEDEDEEVIVPDEIEGEEIFNGDIPNNKPNSNAKRADLDLGKMIGLLNEDGIMGSKAGYDIDALQPKDRVLADEGKQRQQMEALKETDPDAYNKKTGGGNPHPPVKCAIRCAETGILVEKTPFITGAKSADGSRAEGSLFKLIGRTDTARGVSFDIPTNIRVDTRDGRKTVDITEAWITLCFKNDPNST